MADALAHGIARGARGQRKPLGAVADITTPDQAPRRSSDHAGDRRAVLDQRDVDDVLVEAGEEFAGAVERIDDERSRPPVA